MSRSPKHSHYSLSDEHIQRLLQEVEAAQRQTRDQVAARRRQPASRPQVDEQNTAGDARRRELGVRVTELDDRLAAVAASDVAAAHLSARVQQMSAALAECRREAGTGPLERAEQRLRVVGGEMQSLETELHTRSLAERQRGTFVAALLDVLREQGFQARAELDPTAGYAGPVIVRGVDPTQRELITRVPLSGAVTYQGEGFPHREQFDGGGRVATCDEQVRVLEQLHALLNERGIRTGELVWDDKPRRIDADAKAPPHGSAEKSGGRS
jgi:hypothetical protein